MDCTYPIVGMLWMHMIKYMIWSKRNEEKGKEEEGKEREGKRE